MTTLERDGDVYLLNIGDGENRFHPSWVASVSDALADVEAADGARALVTVADGKFFSNGLDLDWLSGHRDEHGAYIDSVHAVFARMLALPVITVAAIQGHAFAAGAMFTLAHDFRVMRADRGFWCLPEVDINMAFTPGMSALIQARLTPQTAHVAMTTGQRYGGSDARAAGIVDDAVAEADVRSSAVALAQAAVGKASSTLGAIKSRMYAPALEALAIPSA